MNLSDVTPLILSFNEEANLPRTLAALSWAQRIVLVDSGSTDGTLRIAAEHPCVDVCRRGFDDHTQQWNFGLQQVKTPWTLSLDADYLCPAELADELAALDGACDAYRAAFRYVVHGKALRGALYPARTVLYRTDRFSYVGDGHTQLLETGSAPIGELTSKILHDDRKPLSRWLAAQRNYTLLEAEKLAVIPPDQLGWKDRLRLNTPFAPLTVHYCLFWKGLILDGLPGIFYTAQRTYAELLLSLELMDRRLARRNSTPPAKDSSRT